MSVAIPITTAISAEAAPTPQLPSLWELGSELQAETVWIARLAERLDSEDDDERTSAIADLEQALAAEHISREAFLRKADATCWVIERLRADASYHASQSKRFSALARREDHRASIPPPPPTSCSITASPAGSVRPWRSAMPMPCPRS